MFQAYSPFLRREYHCAEPAENQMFEFHSPCLTISPIDILKIGVLEERPGVITSIMTVPQP